MEVAPALVNEGTLSTAWPPTPPAVVTVFQVATDWSAESLIALVVLPDTEDKALMENEGTLSTAYDSCLAPAVVIVFQVATDWSSENLIALVVFPDTDS
jgi:hypothetical protein